MPISDFLNRKKKPVNVKDNEIVAVVPPESEEWKEWEKRSKEKERDMTGKEAPIPSVVGVNSEGSSGKLR